MSSVKFGLLAFASTVAAIPQYGHGHSKFHSLKPTGDYATGAYGTGANDRPYPTGGWKGSHNRTRINQATGVDSSNGDGSTNVTSTSTTTIVSTIFIKPSPAASISGSAAVKDIASQPAAGGQCGPATITVTASEKVTITVTPGNSASPAASVLGLSQGYGASGNSGNAPGDSNGAPGGPNGGPGNSNGSPGNDNGGPGKPNGGPGNPNGGPGNSNGGPGSPNGGPGSPNGGPGKPNGGPGNPNGGPGNSNGGPGKPNGGPGNAYGGSNTTSILYLTSKIQQVLTTTAPAPASTPQGYNATGLPYNQGYNATLSLVNKPVAPSSVPGAPYAYSPSSPDAAVASSTPAASSAAASAQDYAAAASPYPASSPSASSAQAYAAAASPSPAASSTAASSAQAYAAAASPSPAGYAAAASPSPAASSAAASSAGAYGGAASPKSSPSSGKGHSGVKRGLAYNDASLCKSTAGSYGFAYNWAQTENNDIGTQYIPMIGSPAKGSSQQWLANVDKAYQKGSRVFMGFNEPDHPDQANLTPEAACSAWKEYMAPIKSKYKDASILGPAVTNGGGSMGLAWLTKFNQVCPDSYDATNIHFYDVPDANTVSRFQAQVEKAIALGNKPVWVTEFGLNPGASQDQAVSFLNGCMKYLDGQDKVQGYAYFMVGSGENQLNQGSGLSPVGKAYAAGM